MMLQNPPKVILNNVHVYEASAASLTHRNLHRKCDCRSPFFEGKAQSSGMLTGKGAVDVCVCVFCLSVDYQMQKCNEKILAFYS